LQPNVFTCTVWVPCVLSTFHCSMFFPLSSSPKWVNFSEEILRHPQRSRRLLWRSCHLYPYMIDDRFSRSPTFRCQRYFTKHRALRSWYVFPVFLICLFPSYIYAHQRERKWIVGPFLIDKSHLSCYRCRTHSPLWTVHYDGQQGLAVVLGQIIPLKSH
jgi:hypothetical protein